MDLTREEALKLHRQMWTDMQNDLGNDPDGEKRVAYKAGWCRGHGFENLKNYCFLCEYAHDKSTWFCRHCPVKWPTRYRTCVSNFLEDGTKLGGDYYLVAPISKILALPERKDV